MRDETRAQTYHAALVGRDPAWDGRVWVGVTSTGIYCRPTCPARKPRADNCRWFDSVAAARAAGFRACRRCDPDAAAPAPDPLVAALDARLSSDPGRRWTEGALAAAGHDPSTVRRAYLRAHGETFLARARRLRLRHGVAALDAGAAVIDAQLDAGFDSASGFRTAFARLFGHPPDALRRPGTLQAAWIDTPLGGMVAVVDDAALHLLEFTDRKALARQMRGLSAATGGRIGLGRTRVTDAVENQLAGFFAGTRPRFALALAPRGTPFQRRVWDGLQAIPAGQTRSYAALAAAIGAPTATRAVAAANACNAIAIVIPCHRVIGSDGTLTGYAGGLTRKRRLIEIERAYG